MFNLDQTISEWRRQMLAAGIKTPRPLDELESHLRDEIEHQTKSGLSVAEAFQIAVQKIGQAHVLQKEFTKVEETKEAREWKRNQILLWVGTSLGSLVMGSLVLFKIGAFSEATSVQQLSGLAAVATMILLILGGRLSHGIFPVILAKRIRDAICISAALLLALWAMVFVHLILPRYDFTIGQLLVMTLWAVVLPAGAIVGFIWGIEVGARKKVAMAGS